MKKYLLILVTIVITYAIGTSIYKEVTRDKMPGKAKRLPCNKMLSTFESCYVYSDFKKAQALLYTGNAHFTSSVKKAVYAKSKLFTFINLKETDKMVESDLAKYITDKKHIKSNYKFSYYIYENDVKDPGKKNDKSKHYGGYVVFDIRNSTNLIVYQVQVDFKNRQGADISKSIKCAIKSIATYKKQKG